MGTLTVAYYRIGRPSHILATALGGGSGRTRPDPLISPQEALEPKLSVTLLAMRLTVSLVSR